LRPQEDLVNVGHIKTAKPKLQNDVQNRKRLSMLSTNSIRNGAFLLSVGSAFAAVIKFISVPLLARLLTPAEFGIAGAALVLVSFATILGGGSGLGTAVTNFKDRREAYDHTAIWTATGVGILVSILGGIYAPQIAASWGAPEAAPHIRVVSLFFPFSFLAGVSFAFLARDMNFKTLTIVNLVASILASIAAIWMAFAGYGAWSLIGQYIIFNIAKCIGHFYHASYRLRFTFNWDRFKDILPFAYRLTLADALMWASAEGPFIIVSRNFGVEFGGIFRAYRRLAVLPREIIGENMARAAYAGMAGRHDDETYTSFIWSTKIMGFILVPVFCWLAALAEPVTRIVLGPQFGDYWMVTVAFASSLILQAQSSMIIPLLKARSHTQTVVYLSAMRAVFILIGTFAGYLITHTFMGTLWGLSVGTSIGSVGFFAYCLQRKTMTVTDVRKAVVTPLILSIVTGICAYGLSQVLTDSVSMYSNVGIATVFGGILYAALVRVFAPADFKGLVSTLRRGRKKPKK
jgi:succinoglycan exporter